MDASRILRFGIAGAALAASAGCGSGYLSISVGDRLAEPVAIALVIEIVSPTRIRLQWSDIDGVARYRVVRDGFERAVVVGVEFVDATLAGAEHCWQVVGQVVAGVEPRSDIVCLQRGVI